MQLKSFIFESCKLDPVLITLVGALSAVEQPDQAVIPPEGSGAVLNEMHSRVICELEETVQDLERRVANLFTDNAQQQEEFTRLKERLVEALEAEVNWNFYPLKFCTCVHMQFAI